MVEDRIAALEQHAAALEARVRELEARDAPVGPPTWSGLARAPERVWPPPGPSVPPPGPGDPVRGDFGRPTRPAPPRRDLEDVLGGSVLAWLGGVAVSAGLAFLLTIAISRGWLGEGARTVLAALVSAALLGGGVWLREHRDRTEAALAAAAVGVAGLFGTVVMAGAAYDLLPTGVAWVGAGIIGATATALAIRWSAVPMGWLGLLGALWAPAALGALDDGVVYLGMAYAATIAVVVWRRWTALAWAAFVTATLQWAAGDPGLVALAGFGLLNATLALGLDARRAGRVTAPALLVLDAGLLVLGHWDDGWLVAIAAVHAAVGIVALRTPLWRVTALVALGLGVGLADLALVALTSGLPVVLGWAGPVLAFAAILGARRHPAAVDPWLATRFAPRGTRLVDAVLGKPGDADWSFAALGLVAQLLLAVGHTLDREAPLAALAGAAPTTEGLVAVGAIGVVAFLAARLSGVVAFDVLALTALAQLTGLALEEAPLTIALAAEAGLLALLDKRASLAFAALAASHALAILAPPLALIDGLDRPWEAAAALLAVTAAFAATRPGRRVVPIALLYLASVEVVTAGGADHTGQALLSGLWALAGVGALIHGLVADHRATRLAGLGLLALTAAKVFGYDLAELDSLARVASFIVLGLLLLLGAFVWQRVRPRSLP